MPDAFTSAMSVGVNGTRVPKAELPGAPSASITVALVNGDHVCPLSPRVLIGNIIAVAAMLDFFKNSRRSISKSYFVFEDRSRVPTSAEHEDVMSVERYSSPSPSVLLVSCQ